MADPYFNQNPYRTTRPEDRRDIPIQPLSPQEEQGLLPKIGGSVLGGIGYLGASLEKALGGRAVRGALGGKYRELASIIPFSDAMGITDYGDRVSGTDLNKQWGLSDGSDSWGNFFGGMATEVLTDPSMYATFGTGALTKAGTAVNKAGILPRTQRLRMGETIESLLGAMQPEARTLAQENLANAFGGGQAGAAALTEHSQAPLAGLFGWRPLPFMPATPVFTGQSGVNALDTIVGAGKGIAAAHHALEKVPVLGTAYSLTAGGLANLAAKGGDTIYRYGRALLDNNALRATSHEGQEIAGDVMHGLPGIMGRDKEFLLGKAQQLKDLGFEDNAAMWRQIEGVDKVDPAIAHVVGPLKDWYGAKFNRANQMGNITPPLQDKYLRELQGPPVPPSSPGGAWTPAGTEEVSLPTEFAHRQWVNRERPGLGGWTEGSGTQPVRPFNASLSAGRERAVSGYLEGTEGVNKALADKVIMDKTIPDRTVVRHMKAQGYIPEDMDVAEALDKVSFLRSLPPLYAEGAAAGQGVAGFGNHPIIDAIHYADSFNRRDQAAEAAYRLMAKHRVDARTAGAAAPQQPVRIMDALKKAGLTDDITNPNIGASQQMIDRLGVGFDDLQHMVVDKRLADELMRYTRPFQTPEYVNPILKGYDRISNIFKTLVTTPWPGFHVRNFFGGGYQNAQAGGLGALGETGAGYKMVSGQTVPGLNAVPGLEGLSEAAAHDKIAMEMAAYNVGGHLQGQAADLLGPTGQRIPGGKGIDQVLNMIPGRDPQSLSRAGQTLIGGGDVAGESLRDRFNPVMTAGFGAEKDIFTPVAAGRVAGNVVEGTNRGALYMSLRKQGYSAEQAAREVLGAHFDYSGNALTDFEKSVMRRIVPFYSFSRFNSAFTGSQLFNNPGGLAGTYTKGALDARQNDQFLPPFLGNGLAVPLGAQDDKGNRPYLTRLDLPTEQAAEMIKPGGLGGILEGVLAQTNPMIKGPLELASNRQFFTGRDLEDVNTMTGNTAADQLLMNSPAARAVTTVRTLGDEKKWEKPWTIPLNLLTGAKVTDVDIPKYKSIAEREYVESLLRGQPGIGKYETLAIRPEAIGQMTQQQLILARLQKTLEERARQEGLKRRAIAVQ